MIQFYSKQQYQLDAVNWGCVHWRMRTCDRCGMMILSEDFDFRRLKKKLEPPKVTNHNQIELVTYCQFTANEMGVFG